jgi:arginine deiminase
MAELESVPEIEVVEDEKKSTTQESEETRAKKAVEEIKAANEEYQKLDRALREKRLEVEKLQTEAYTALQRATSLNEQFNMSVNSQLLQERNKLKEEVDKLRTLVEKNLKVTKKATS